MPSRATLFAAIVVLLPWWIGCGRETGVTLYGASGKVTLDSAPLDHGTIRFCPTDTQAGILSGASIADGQYSIPRDKGLPAGKYTVRISSADPSSALPAGPSGEGPPLEERLPPRYNSKSELNVQVEPDGENMFNFDLTSRAGK